MVVVFPGIITDQQQKKVRELLNLFYLKMYMRWIKPQIMEDHHKDLLIHLWGDSKLSDDDTEDNSDLSSLSEISMTMEYGMAGKRHMLVSILVKGNVLLQDHGDTFMLLGFMDDDQKQRKAVYALKYPAMNDGYRLDVTDEDRVNFILDTELGWPGNMLHTKWVPIPCHPLDICKDVKLELNGSHWVASEKEST